MRNIVNTYIDRFRHERRTRRRTAAILLTLAVVVAGSVFWQLRYTGVAMANETYCGYEEHTHTDECYETVLTCGLEEAEATEGHTHDESCYETVQTLTCGQEESEEHTHSESCYTTEEVLFCEQDEEEAEEGHTHDDSCYEEVLVCEIPEHVHTMECMSDETADVETAKDWEAMLPKLTGIRAEDVVAVAQSQIGYEESTKNFQYDEETDTQKGYTRYGAWYGNEYGDWDAMFASFVLHYAGVPESEFPVASGVYAWTTDLNKKGIYEKATDTNPSAGDLIFFDRIKDDGEEGQDGKADHVGIVENVEMETSSKGEETAARIQVIEGDRDDAVCEVSCQPDDPTILGYGILPETSADNIKVVDLEEVPAGDVLYHAADGGVDVSVSAPAGALPEGAELTVALLEEDSAEYAEAAETVSADIAVFSAGEETTGSGMAVLDISFKVNGEEMEPAEAVQMTIDASAIVPEDAGSIVVQHLVETEEGVKPEVVATVSAEDPVAEFEVESFSKFTIEWNDGTGDTITVHVYTTDGVGIEEVLDTEYNHNSGDILIADIVGHLHGTVSSIHYEYATVYYEISNGMNGYDAYTVGSADNPVTEISKSGTTYTVTLGNGTTEVVSNPVSIDIHLYYSIPTITIETNDGHSEATVNFTTSPLYFKGLEVTGSVTTYSWSLSDDSKGTIVKDEQGGATFSWSFDVGVGDSVTITVTMTNTYTDETSGEEITETASDAYTLTYGEQAVTITVNNNGGTTVGEYARVALVDENGNTVATGTTGTDGTVTLYAIPGTYTVGVTYITDTGTGPNVIVRYTGTVDATVVNSTEGNSATVTLDGGVAGSSISGSSDASDVDSWDPETPYYYDHVDVKVAVVGEEGASVVFSDLDKVYVYDKYGNLIYWSEDLIANDDTTDYNCEFDYYEDEDTHFIVVSSEDTVVITYEVLVTYDDGTTETKTYTITMKGDGTYGNDEYYGYENVNAYQLYNCIYGTSIAEAEWETAFEAGTLEDLLSNYNENGISISGLYYLQVADYLCDTRASSQAGLDFVIDVEAVDEIIFDWDFAIAKSYVGVPEALVSSSQFGFTLTEAETTNNESAWMINGDATEYEATTDDWTKDDGSNDTYSSTARFNSQEFETTGGTEIYYYILQENASTEAEAANPYYGIKVTVTVNATTGSQSVVVSYCVLISGGDGTFTMSDTDSGWMPLTAENDGVYYLPFINTYNSVSYPVDIYKYTGEIIDPVWTSTTTTEGNPNATDTYYLRYSGTDENGDTVYYYAIGTGVGTLEDPFNVTVWTTDQSAADVISVTVAANTGTTYYFTGVIGNTNVVFEFDHTDGTETDEYLTLVEGTGTYGTALSGAEFTLSYTTGEGESEVTYYAVLTSDGGTGAYTLISWSDSESDATRLVSGSDGYIHMEGLSAGIYTLTEIEAPDGYNLLDADIMFTIDEDGIVTVPENPPNVTVGTNNGVALLAVVNIAAGELPMTGGRGTILYTLLGLIMIGGAGGLLYRRKRGEVRA